jgi:hypothetical protein
MHLGGWHAITLPSRRFCERRISDDGKTNTDNDALAASKPLSISSGKHANEYNFRGSFASEVSVWILKKIPSLQIGRYLAAPPKPKYTRALRST